MTRITIPGPIPSLKNQKRIGKGRMYDDPQVEAFKDQFYLFVPLVMRMAKLGSKKKHLRVDVKLFAADWRRDADVEILYDCLQACGVISNDRWIRMKFVDATKLDAINPRAEITIIELAPV